MSCIHFKFKNRQDYEKVPIDGLEVSGKELKEAIMKKKKIGHSNLEITDAQTKKVYSDTDMIKRNASVIVMRSVIQNAAKLPKTQHKDPSLLPAAGLDSQTYSANPNDPQKTSDLTALTGSEEDKLMAMMKQAGEGYTADDYAKYPARGIHPGFYRGPPPRGYVCNRCRKPGHWIQLCPTNGDPNYDKRNRQEMLPKTNTVGSMKAKHMIPAPPKEKEIPDELKCPICKEPLRDAVVIPCCNKTFCDECIREHLLENEFTCPLCEEEDVSPDSLAPNKELREAVKQLKSQAAEEKSIAVASLFSRASLVPHVPPKLPVTTPAHVLLAQLTSKSSSSSSSLFTSATSASSSVVASALKSTTASSASTLTSSPQRPAAVSVESRLDDAEGDKHKDGEEQKVLTTGASAVPAADEHKIKEDVTVPDTEKTEYRSDTGNRDIPAGGDGRQSSSPQRDRSKSPIPPVTLETKKPTQPITLSSNYKRPRHTLHPHHHPLITGLPPPHVQLPLPLIHNRVSGAGLPGNPNLLNSLPGLGVVPTAPPPVVKDYQAEADFLLGQKRARPASPPLTAEEFYRQQKMLHQFILRKSPVHSMEPGSDHSYSSNYDSYDESDSQSTSDSVSESDASDYSHRHSRSVSPMKKKSTVSRKPEAHHRHNKKKRSKELLLPPERGREGGRHKRKRRRHETPDNSEIRHGHSKRHRHQPTSKTREGSIDRHHHSSDAVSSTTSDVVRHHSGHKRSRKRKHRRHRHHGVREEGEGGIERDMGQGTEDNLEEDKRVVVPKRDLVVGAEKNVEVNSLEGRDARGDSNEAVSVVNDNIPVSEEKGEVPVIRVNEALAEIAMTETKMTTEQDTLTEVETNTPPALENIVTGKVNSEYQKVVTGREPLSDMAGTSVNAGRVVSKSLERVSSADQLMDDIDRLLAEDKSETDEEDATLTPVVNTVTAEATSVVDIEPNILSAQREQQLKSEGVIADSDSVLPSAVAEVEQEREGEEGEEEKEGEDGERKEEEREMEEVVEGYQLYLHANETIDEEEEDDSGGDDGSNEGGLEEGELLSDVDTAAVDQPPAGDPGQVTADPTSIPNRLLRKTRLRSVASTVQVVNSSETPDMTPSDVESSPPPSPPSPLPAPLVYPSPPPEGPVREEMERAVKRKHRHHHHHKRTHDRHHEVVSKQKKRKLKEKEKISASHRHRQERREREILGEVEKERRRDRERGRRRREGEGERGRRRQGDERHRHHHRKKHRQHPL